MSTKKSDTTDEAKKAPETSTEPAPEPEKAVSVEEQGIGANDPYPTSEQEG